MLTFGLLSASAAPALGAILAAVDGAQTSVTIGAAVVGVLGVLVGLVVGSSQPRGASAVGVLTRGAIGLVGGAAGGALLGGLVVAVVGSVPGSIVGVLAARRLARRKDDAPFTWGLAGACAGGLALAVYHEWAAALAGSAVGALAGLVGGAVLAFAYTLLMGLLIVSGE